MSALNLEPKIIEDTEGKSFFPNSAGERLKRLRYMAGFSTRKAFERASHISVNTLQGWEQNKNKLTLKGGRKLVDFFWSRGLICTLDWLLFGNGITPYFNENTVVSKNSTILDSSVMEEEECIYTEKKEFLRINSNGMITQVLDNAMEGLYQKNDFVGGIKVPETQFSTFLGKPCIVELPHNGTTIQVVRILSESSQIGHFTLNGANFRFKGVNLNYFDIRPTVVAPIIWHRSRLKRL